MRVIVIGAGEIGEAVVKHVCLEGHDVVVVDLDENKVNAMTDEYDCNGFVGNGAASNLLIKAGIEAASLLIATTDSDETNLLCAYVAKQLGVNKTMAVVRDSEFKKEHQFFKKHLGVDAFINPERTAATEIQRLLRYPNGVRVEQFGDANVQIATITVQKDSAFVGQNLMNLRKNIAFNALVCTVEHKGKLLVPKGDTVISEGDILTAIAVGDEMDIFLNKLGVIEKIIKKVLVVGGGKIGRYLTEYLLQAGVKVKLMEKDAEKCKMLLEKYPKAQVICADAMDADELKQELAGMDALVAASGNDDENFVISMFAKSFGVERISAQVEEPSLATMIRESGVSHIFSIQDACMAGVLRNIRVISKEHDEDNDTHGKIHWLNTMNDGRVEAMEFEVKDGFKYAGIELKSEDFKIKSNMIVATIIHGAETELANGNSKIAVGDKVIVVSADQRLTDITEIYA